MTNVVKYFTVPSYQQKKVCPNILFCDSYYVIDEESKNVDERNNSRSKESSLKKVVKNKNVAKKLKIIFRKMPTRVIIIVQRKNFVLQNNLVLKRLLEKSR